MLDLSPFFQTILTIFGITGVIGIIWIGFRSRLPSETIRVQTENIQALQESHKINSLKIIELEGKVSKLEAENKVLKTLPLEQIATTQEKILHLLETQNEILKMMTPSSSVTISSQ